MQPLNTIPMQLTETVNPRLLTELFDRVDVSYKMLNGTPFPAAILVPKRLCSVQHKTCPLLVHFHGGGLYMGTNPEPAFTSRWVLELAVAEGAIFVSPAYRLIPEATGADILDDVNDFWSWAHASLPTCVAETWPGLQLDASNAAAVGESAGGYLALQSAFLQPVGTVRAVMAQYCAIFPDIPAWNPQPADGGPAEAHALIDRYLADIPPDAIRLSTPFPGMVEFGIALKKTGRRKEWMGSDERLTLDYGLRVAELPPMWILQAIQDRILVKEATDDMVARIHKAHPDTPLLYSVRPGDHGFDSAHGLDEPYIAEGVAFVRRYWPLKSG